MRHNNLYIFCTGRVAAIDKKTGELRWEVKLKTLSKKIYASAHGTIVEEGEKLFIGCSGFLICLNKKDGSLLWMNELKGWGYGFVSIAGKTDDVQMAAIAGAQATATAGAT